MLDQQVKPWTVSDAAELYEVGRWGKGYFSVYQQGHVLVHPTKDPATIRSISSSWSIACSCAASTCRS